VRTPTDYYKLRDAEFFENGDAFGEDTGFPGFCLLYSGRLFRLPSLFEFLVKHKK
jgi:hypothetical protein